jgi:hypothetical protein
MTADSAGSAPSSSPGFSDSPRFVEALRRFDEENAHDPKGIDVDGTRQPYELGYSRWVTDWVLRLRPDASEALRLAARCQHLRRWEIPRTSYEMRREGYLRWREDLKEFHAAQAAAILRKVGYSEEVIARVNALNLKANRTSDLECQTLEDALCLVTLERQMEELIAKTAPEKMAGILQKTWRKMSEAARQHARRLPLSPPAVELCRAAGIIE